MWVTEEALGYLRGAWQHGPVFQGNDDPGKSLNGPVHPTRDCSQYVGGYCSAAVWTRFELVEGPFGIALGMGSARLDFEKRLDRGVGVPMSHQRHSGFVREIRQGEV